MTELYIALCTLVSNAITALIAYKTGKKKSDNEATKVAFEAYNYAIESLRKEFETRYELLQKENAELRKEIEELRKKKK